MDWENHLQKKSDPKNRKTVKIKVKLPHVNKKTTSEKANFLQTPFSHSTLKLEKKKFLAAKPLAFIMKMCEQILRKRPQYNSNSLNCKNQEHHNIALLSLQL